jgi:hypothetical protein
LAVGPEQADDAGTPAGDMSGVVLAHETTTSVAFQQRANPKRTDDAGTLARDLSDISLAPEITTHSIPDATSPPSIDQKIPSVFHPVPFRFSFDPPSDPASVSAFARAYPDLPGYHMWSTWDRLTAVSTSGPAGSKEEDDPDFSWDFSGLRDPSAMQDFMSACDYCLSSYSDDGHSLDDEGYNPTHECFHIDQGDHNEDDHLGMPENDDAPAPASRVEIPRELAVVRVPAGGQGTQLEQLHEMHAKLDEETGQLVQLRQNIKQEWAGRALAGGAHHRARDVQCRIIDDARVGLPPAFSGAGQNLTAAAMLLRTMPEPSTTKGRCIQGELKDLLENAAVRRVESSASRRRGCPSEHRATSSRRMREASVHTERTGTGRLQPRIASAASNTAATVEPTSRKGCAEATTLGTEDDTTVRRIGAPHPNHQVCGSSTGPYDGRRSQPGSEPRLPSPSTQGRQGWSCGSRRLACQLGGTDDDNLIIRNLPLFLSDAARAWLEHLPPAQIFGWDDLVKAFAGNFQGTYVRPGNSWDLRSCCQQLGESLREYIWRFSKQCTELPNITDSDVIGAFLAGTTCRDLVSKLGRKTPTKASELMDIATKFASGQEVVEAIFRKDKQLQGRQKEDAPEASVQAWHEEEEQEEGASKTRRR